MGVNYRRPLDFKCNKARARARVYGGTFPSRFPSSNKYELYPKVSYKQGNKTLTCNRLHQRSKKNRKIFLSNIFTVPKKNGDLRLVINLKDLNQFLAFHHFKMESFQTAKDLIQEGDWMIKLDLKEAYHSVPVTPDHQRYLAFLWDGKCYVYCVLPFGLGPAPRVFTKITKPILVHIRQNLVIPCVMYLDDLLIFGRTKSDCLQKAKKVMTLLQELGFTINIKKSILEPTQQIEFLGLILDSIQIKVFLPEPKVLDLIESCQAILSMRSLTARSLASLQGKMSSCLHAVLPAPTFYRAIQADIHQAIGKANNFSKKLILSSEAKSEIQWWMVNVRLWNGRPVHLPSPSLVITTDAAKKGGWGASCNKHKIQGRWTQEEASLHINILELKAALFALKSFAKVYQMTNAHVRFKIDNTPAQAYINHQGGTKSVGLCNQAQELWKHLSGIHNWDADQASRIFNDRTEWMISPHLLREALSLLAPNPSIDLFASRLNKQFPIFCSWKPDPDAWKIDAFSFPWLQKGLYAFPPFCLVGKVLAKVIQDKSQNLVLVTPWWPSQPWFPLLKSLAITQPRFLKETKRTLVLPHSQDLHPLWRQLKLAVWVVSGDKKMS